MALSARTFRVFVSSTFEDLKEERDVLQREVFPALQEFCLARGARFQAVDLRWGVSEQAGVGHQTIEICLSEIGRCRTVSPRPNFIVLLGDRFGWCPPPSEIPAVEFDVIRERVGARADRELLAAWYPRDDNAVPPVHYLRPREGEFVAYEAWVPIEHRLRSVLVAAVAGTALSDDPRYVGSATEQEIVKGALAIQDAHEHVFCFFRTIDGLPNDRTAGSSADVGTDGTLDGGARSRLEGLKIRLRSALPGNVFDYRANWRDNRPSAEHLQRLAADVRAVLTRVISRELERLDEVDPLEHEIERHREFGAERARDFTGRQLVLTRIARYLGAGGLRPLAILGESGAGKSTLIAQAAAAASRDRPGTTSVVRFIGHTPQSSGGREMLASLCRQVVRAYAAQPALIGTGQRELLDESTLPSQYNELAVEFGRRLALASPQAPLVVFIDALDQLPAGDPARALSWLPDELPDGVRIVVSSTRPREQISAPRPEVVLTEPYAALQARLPAEQLYELERMEQAEGAALLDAWLASVGRTLRPEQRAHVIERFELEGLPLYLKLAFEQARRWRSDTPAELTRLAIGIRGVIRTNLFARLAAEEQHGATLLARSLGYLAAAKNGLTEDELLDVLSADSEVLASFRRRSPKSPIVDRLPPVVWSRLYFDLEPYLSEHSADGTTLLSFYHRQLREVVDEDYLAEEAGIALHRQLAAYFADEAAQPLERYANGVARANLRRLSELPYQQTTGELGDDVVRTLTDFRFIELKVQHAGVTETVDVTSTHTGVYLLEDDYTLALSGTVKRRNVLAAFGRALENEAHNLSRYPELAWQQLYNRLHWPNIDAADILGGELKRRTLPGASPWLRSRTRSGESQSLIRTLTGHTDLINACAISPDGRFIVSASQDHTLKVWEARTGIEIRSLIGHTLTVRGCDISPDGSQIVSAGGDDTFRLWNLMTGELVWTHTLAKSPGGPRFSSDGSYIATPLGTRVLCWDVVTGEAHATGEGLLALDGHAATVEACAISPDGGFIVSASRDHTLKIWDAATGEELRTLVGHSGEVGACAISRDCALIVSGSEDGTLKLWDAATGNELHSLAGHSGRVSGCAITADGAYVVSASWDGTLTLWDVQSGRPLHALTGHSAGVSGCAASPDGAYIVSVSWDNTLKLWDPAVAALGGGELPTVSVSQVVGCAVLPDGAAAVSADMDGMVRKHDLTSGEARILTAPADRETLEGCAVSPDGSYVVVATRSGELKMLDTASGIELRSMTGHNGAVWACAISQDGSFIVSAGADGTVRMWDPVAGEQIRVLAGHVAAPGEGVRACAVSGDGSFILSGGFDGVRFWDPSTGEQLASIACGRVAACAVSPDSRYAVWVGADQRLYRADILSGEISTLSTEIGDDEAPTSNLAGGKDLLRKGCAITPDARHVVLAHGDRTVSVWDLAGGIEVARAILVARATCAAVDPHWAIAVFGERGGSVYAFDLIGIEYQSRRVMTPAQDRSTGAAAARLRQWPRRTTADPRVVELRRERGLRSVHPDEVGIKLADLPAGVYGYVTHRSARRVADVGLFQADDIRSSVFEVHKPRNGDVQLIGYVEEDARAGVAATGELRLFSERSPAAPQLASVPIRTIAEVQPYITEMRVGRKYLRLKLSGDEPNDRREPRGGPTGSSRLRAERVLRRLRADEAELPVSRLPAGVYGFVVAWCLDSIADVELSPDQTGTAVVEIHKLSDDDVELIAYMEPAARARIDLPGVITVLPQPSGPATEQVSIAVDRILDVKWSQGDGAFPLELRLAGATGIGSAAQLRKARRLRPVSADEEHLSIGELPAGVFGFCVPWLVDRLARIELSGESGGTCVVEVHKFDPHDAELIGYVGAAALERIRQAGEFTVYNRVSEHATNLVAIPFTRIIEASGDDPDKPLLLSLSADATVSSASTADAGRANQRGVLLYRNGDLEGALAAFREADALGSGAGAQNCGALLEEQGDLRGAEAPYRRADSRGDAGGANRLGALLYGRGDLDGALAAFRRADDRGNASGAHNLGQILQQRGDLPGAEAAYRRADQRGDDDGANALGVLLHARGDLDGALAAFCRGVDRGLRLAGENLAAALAGSTWQLDTEGSVQFLSDHLLAWTEPPTGGRWMSAGRKLTFDHGGLTIYDVALEGSVMTGSWRRADQSATGRVQLRRSGPSGT